jgi:RNA polymerase sigma factor (sigma-70 family)
MTGEMTGEMTGSEQAFERFFRSRRDAVRRTAYLLCGDWHSADDLAQTAFVALHRKWHTIREPAALDAYLRRTLVRALIDEARRPWRRERLMPEPPEPSRSGLPESRLPGSQPAGLQPGGLQPAGLHPTLDGPAERVATRTLLVDALRQLPPRQRAVLVLRYLEGLDVASTARALGCREGTVKSQTAHGLTALRAALGDALDDLHPTG